MALHGITRAGSRLAFAAIGVLCLVTVSLLVNQTRRNLVLLEFARTDNEQWGLSQIEVEFLELLNLANKPNPDLVAVRTKFDIFYSRMAIVAEAPLYRGHRTLPDFVENLSAIRSQLDALIPLVDARDSDFLDGIDRFRAALEPLRPRLRRLATLGVARSMAMSEERRVEIRQTLAQLAVLTVLLILALAALVVLTMRAERRARQHGNALAAANTRLEKVLETSLEAVVVSDCQGRIVEFNPAAERIFQRSKDSVVGKSVGDTIVPKDSRQAHEAGMARLRKGGAPVILGQGRVRLDAVRADGTVFPVEMALELANAENETIVIGFLRDISRRVRAEDALVEARDKALAGEQAKADFLAMMTHEIRTPLNGLLGNLSLLADTDLTDTQTRLLRNMRISGSQLQEHVDAVLDIARFDKDPVGDHHVPVRIGCLVQDIVDAQSAAAQSRGNALTWGWVGDPVDWLDLDVSRVQQVLINLIDNAIKFTRNGVVRIELQQDSGDGPSLIEIRVIDTGAGIPEAMRDTIFDDFHTAPPPDGEDVGGTGLGLGIVRRFVTAMSGEISVESTPGKGSIFRVRLPAEQAAPPDTAANHKADKAPLPRCRVLLVEDNAISMQVARGMLDGLGQSVQCAGTGVEALARAQAERFDMILMDMRMPQMDGLTATGAIRASHGPNRATPIVVLSANVLPEARETCLAAGVSGFLGKPLRREEMAQVIRKLCKAKPRAALDAQQSQERPIPAQSVTDALHDRFKTEMSALFDDLATEGTALSEIAERCHQCAGSAGVFGHETLALALLEAENQARAGMRPETDTALARARQVWSDRSEAAGAGR